MQLVVADTGPLHYLVLTGDIELLPKLFERALVPQDGQGESQRSKLDVLALCLDVLHPRSTRHRAHHSVQTGHDGGQLVE